MAAILSRPQYVKFPDIAYFQENVIILITTDLFYRQRLAKPALRLGCE